MLLLFFSLTSTPVLAALKEVENISYIKKPRAKQAIGLLNSIIIDRLIIHSLMLLEEFYQAKINSIVFKKSIFNINTSSVFNQYLSIFTYPRLIGEINTTIV